MICMADYDEDCKGKKPEGCMCYDCCLEDGKRFRIKVVSTQEYYPTIHKESRYFIEVKRPRFYFFGKLVWRPFMVKQFWGGHPEIVQMELDSLKEAKEYLKRLNEVKNDNHNRFSC